MSRIGKKLIVKPDDVTVGISKQTVDVSGKLGSLRHIVPAGISVKMEDGKVVVERASESNDHKAKHGLTRTLIANMIEGVSKGFSKSLTIKGVGYKAQKQGTKLVMNLGLSHTVEFEEGNGISFEIPSATEVIVKGIDKQRVGEIAAKIKKARPVEPYHHYGIRYTGEFVRKKEGKKGGKK